MADEPKPIEPEATEPPEAAPATGLAGRIARLVHWAGESKLRMGLLGLLFVVVFGGTFATWSYLAHLAVSENDKYTLEKALVALDKQDFEEAKSIIGEMKEREAALDFGGSLFVLGAVKSAQADQEWSQARQRAMHLIAARYLQKARELGVPSERAGQAQFLLGQSLVRGNQPQAGIEVLQVAINDSSLPTVEIHALLASAYQSTPEPNLVAALKHNQAVLDDPELDEQRRTTTSITQADILGKMGRLKEAEQFLHLSNSSKAQQARMKSIAGRLAIAEARRFPAGSEQRKALAVQARKALQEALLLDPLSSELTRQAMYWIGQSYEIVGNQAAAIQEYDKLSKSYGDTAESMTAMLAKADLARKARNYEQAMIGYRAVSTAVGDPVTYVNRLLPLSALQKRLLNAQNDFVETEHFEEAMALVDALQSVFSLKEATELRAQTHKKWAQAKYAQAGQFPAWEAEEYLSEGRYHNRAAGTAYELLSKLRFASRSFTDDLWQAADNYFLGQSYSHAERMLTEYLHHDALGKQALALLRLGQSQLAQGKNRAAAETLEECIELHPGDAVVYQARLECAQAYLQQDQGERAEQLLLSNLVGAGLEPAANEWRDSLFLLGEYLHNSQQYYEAIKELDDAVRRYPDVPQSLFARYTIARSFHSASEKPAQLALQAKTENERQKNGLLRDENLEEALKNYLQVQRMLTLQGHVESNELSRTLLRNCYMMQGSVLFQLKRYEEARKAYANISTLYQNEPSVLESFVHIANCYRRLNKPVKAKGTIEQAKLVLGRLPEETDFMIATNFSRRSWELLLNEMSAW